MNSNLAAVVPAYKVKNTILTVVSDLLDVVDVVIVVDDMCPEKSGNYLQKSIKNENLHLVFHKQNKGVGGALVSGYRKAKELGSKIIVKVDGDGQMDVQFIPKLIAPIKEGNTDFLMIPNKRYTLGVEKKLLKEGFKPIHNSDAFIIGNFK